MLCRHFKRERKIALAKCKKMTIKPVCAALLMMLASRVNAGQLQNIPDSNFSNLTVPSDGQIHEYSYYNNTGGPIYIRKLKVFVLVGGPGGVCLGWIETWRESSHNQTVNLTYWQRYAADGYGQGAGSLTANQINEDFSPDSILLAPGDEIAMAVLSNVPNGTASFVTAWIWYSTTP